MTRSIIALLFLALAFSQCSKKTVDSGMDTAKKMEKKVENNIHAWRSQAPSPAPAKSIELGKAATFDLANGLKVIVVENHKLPRVSYQLSLKTNAILEGDQAGYSSIAGDLLSTGTKTRSKADIDEAIDYIGGRFSTNAFSMYASSLTKHSDALLDVVSDVLYNPAFKQEEFDKIKKQNESGIADATTNPQRISSTVASAVNYGKNHPYGEVVTQASLDKITLQKCKEFYNSYYKPNNAYLVIVGDITPAAAKMQAEKYFGAWKKGEVPNPTFNKVMAPSERKVAVANKDGAVQSVIRVTYPIDLKPGDDDEIAASVMNSILGGGVFSGRLMQNLREDKAYTYGARSSLRSDSEVGVFTASASVRNEVTDSSVHEFLYELERLRDEPVDQADLDLTLSSMTGSFARSLESPQTIARFARNTIKYGLPDDYYSKYLQKLNAVTVADVQRVAKKYLRPDNANIVVVGSADDIAPSLKKFDANGVIDFYDAFGNKVERKMTPVNLGVSGEQIVKDYVKALGGDKLKSVKNMYTKYSMNAMGQSITTEMYQSAPNKMAMITSMAGNVMSEQKYDGMKGYVGGMGGSQIITEGESLDDLKSQAKMFPALEMLEKGYKIDIKGEETINDMEMYKLQVTDDKGEKSIQYYGKADKLLHKISVNKEGQQGQMMQIETVLDDYKSVDGIMVPYLMSITGAAPFPMDMKVEEVKINGEIPASTYMIK